MIEMKEKLFLYVITISVLLSKIKNEEKTKICNYFYVIGTPHIMYYYCMYIKLSLTSTKTHPYVRLNYLLQLKVNLIEKNRFSRYLQKWNVFCLVLSFDMGRAYGRSTWLAIIEHNIWRYNTRNTLNQYEFMELYTIFMTFAFTTRHTNT